jgi:molecular chaperone GrpE
LEPENRNPQHASVILSEHFNEAKTKDALKALILQRFARWLDDVLTDEQTLEGVPAELLTELYDDQQPNGVDPGAGAYDLHSTWSAITALTQEIKLQGRTFKQLSEKIEPFDSLNATVDQLATKHETALSEARRIAEEGRMDRRQRESELQTVARNRARRELIGLIIEIRDSLMIGMGSAAESHEKLEEYRNRSRLKKIFRNNSEDQKHQLEIVDSLKKGYQMGLDRMEESLQQLGVTEIQSVGNLFDPRIMNAVDIAETDEVPDGTVLELYRAGYLIDDEVLQPAQVKVARNPK